MAGEDINYAMGRLMRCLILLEGENAGLWTLSEADEAWIANVADHSLGA